MEHLVGKPKADPPYRNPRLDYNKEFSEEIQKDKEERLKKFRLGKMRFENECGKKYIHILTKKYHMDPNELFTAP